MRTINIARDFSKNPGARTRVQGPNSGQEFRQRFLEPLYTENPNEPVLIQLDGLSGLPPSFVYGAFYELAKWIGFGNYLNFVRFEGPEALLEGVNELNRWIISALDGIRYIKGIDGVRDPEA